MQTVVIQKKKWAGLLLFLAAAAAGLFWAKWEPYYHKVLAVAESHTLGNPILSALAAGSTPSWDMALGYATSYFLAIWKAMLVAIVLASLMNVFIPKSWVEKIVGRQGYGATVRGGLLGLPAMMCTCCAAPVVAGLRQKNSSVGAAVAFWFANTALNPVVLVFMLFILGWKFTLLRLVCGVVLVFGVSYLANRIAGSSPVDRSLLMDETDEGGDRPFQKWAKTFGKLVITIVPIHFVTVLLLGGLQAWLFPASGMAGANSLWLIVTMAIVGTLFVIPTAAEVAIAAAMLSLGIGSGPVAALVITLPVISIPAALMLRKVLPAKVMVFLSVSVVVLGVVAGVVASWF